MRLSVYKNSRGLRAIVLRAAKVGLEGVLPKNFMSASLQLVGEKFFVQGESFSLHERRIFVIGAGKASAAMAVELEKILGVDRIEAGLVISNDIFHKPKKIQVHYSTHPIPSKQGVVGVERILALKKKYNLKKEDLIISLISGGASSLMAGPIPGISLSDKKKLTRLLLKAGKNGYEIPTVKKKISMVKGGKLGNFFYPTPIISLVLSDVLNNDLSVIGSGPFTQDNATNKEAWEIIKTVDSIPKTIALYIKRHKNKKIVKQNLSHVKQFIIGSNDTALGKIKEFILKKGYQLVIGRHLQGEAKDEADKICEEISRKKISGPTVYLYGGETAVNVAGGLEGKGGRNQEFVLSCLNWINTHFFPYHWAILSLATDGVDFIEESAGGIIDESTLMAVRKKRLNIASYLGRHNSFEILKQLNAQINGGITGTNVGDIIIFLLKPSLKK